MKPKAFHPEELALLAAIHAQPRDDTPRLVYADWLQEHDQPEYAEFIRLQCQKPYIALTNYLAADGYDLCPDFPAPSDDPESHARFLRLRELAPHARTETAADWDIYFRGLPLIDRMIVSCEAWMAWDALEALGPATRVILTIQGTSRVSSDLSGALALALMERVDVLRLTPDDAADDDAFPEFEASDIALLTESRVIDRLHELNLHGCLSPDAAVAVHSLLKPRVLVRVSE